MLAQRRRRWANINPALVQGVVLAGPNMKPALGERFGSAGHILANRGRATPQSYTLDCYSVKRSDVTR